MKRSSLLSTTDKERFQSMSANEIFTLCPQPYSSSSFSRRHSLTHHNNGGRRVLQQNSTVQLPRRRSLASPGVSVRNGSIGSSNSSINSGSSSHKHHKSAFWDDLRSELNSPKTLRAQLEEKSKEARKKRRLSMEGTTSPSPSLGLGSPTSSITYPLDGQEKTFVGRVAHPQQTNVTKPQSTSLPLHEETTLLGRLCALTVTSSTPPPPPAAAAVARSPQQENVTLD